MNLQNYNNIGISSVSIIAVLAEVEKLSIAKTLLIFPFFAHKDLTKYLGHKRTNIKSIEKLVADKTQYFSNFNARYYDSLDLSINAIQFLIEQEVIKLNNGSIEIVKDLVYNKKMGSRAERIFKASKNMACILNETAEKLYLNLRIEL